MKFHFFNTGFPKVTYAFLVVILIVLVNVIFNIYSIRKNKSRIIEMTEVINPYVEALEELNLVVTESKMYATNWVYLQNSINDKKNLDSLHKFHYPGLKKKLGGFFGKLNMKGERDSLEAVYSKFDELIGVEKEIMRTLVTFDDYENPQKKFKCEEIIESEVLPRTQSIMTNLDKIIDRNRQAAMKMKTDIEKASRRMMTIMLAASVFLFFFIFFTISFISGAIRKPVLKMKQIIVQLARGELPDEKIEVKDNNVVAEMAGSVNALSESFAKTSIFANEIGKGHLTVEYEKLSENDILGNALINMRNSLHAYSENMEQQVKERTQEVMDKSQKLELAYREIRDSINYAKRIQESILPADEMIEQVFPESLIFYRPKDIVCGDFYWFSKHSDEVVFAAFDCTGHGVPGALMTVIGNSLLNQIINFSGITDPAGILSQLDKKLHETLKQHGNIATNDGMDAAVCRYRISRKELTYAGAKRPLYIFKKGELIEIKGNKSPIGSFGHNYDKLFSNHKVNINSTDTIYLFTDGLQDQFGGPDGKKYMIKRFRELLADIQSMKMKEQLADFNREFTGWQGRYDQTDDMLLMGVRF